MLKMRDGMELGKELKGLIIAGICGIGVALATSALFVEHHEHFFGFYALYGAIGVGFFLLTTKILSAIQKEGSQDD